MRSEALYGTLLPSFSYTATSSSSMTARDTVLQNSDLLEEIFVKFESPTPFLDVLLHPDLPDDVKREEQANRRALLSIALTSRKVGEAGSCVLWRNLNQKGLGHFVRMIQKSYVANRIDVSILLSSIS